MCGRASITLTEKELEKQFGKSFYSDDINRYNPLPNYNIAPTHYIPLITNNDTHHFQYFKWGLLPSWAKDEKYGSRLINARMETVEEKASFKSSFLKRRCLIPLSGYYEWLQQAGMKYPFRILRADRAPFLVAGIWNIWKGSGGKPIPTFSILTRDALENVKYIHNRMPAILPMKEEFNWLDMELSPASLKELIYSLKPDVLTAYHVSDKINSVHNNDKSLIREVDPPAIQQSLF